MPVGTVTPLENVNGRNARRLEGTGKKRRADRRSESVFHIWGAEEGTQRTGEESTKP